MRLVSVTISILLFTHLFSQNNTDSSFSKLNLILETGIQSVQSINSHSILCYQGQLELGFGLSNSLTIGVFGNTLFYYQNLDLSNIEGKIIDMSSIEYNTVGVSISYIFNLKKFEIVPKLDIGYNFLNAKAIDFNIDNAAFIDYRYLSLTPKLNFRYKLSDAFSIGLFGGYSNQVIALKGSKTEIFNPSSISIGLNTRILIK